MNSSPEHLPSLAPENRRELLLQVSRNTLSVAEALAALGVTDVAAPTAVAAGPTILSRAKGSTTPVNSKDSNSTRPVPSPEMKAPASQPGPGHERLPALMAGLLETIFNRRLGRVGRIDWDSTFEPFGVDSIMVLELVRRLEDDFGALPKTLLFEYNSLAKLAGYFIEAHREKSLDLLGLRGPALGRPGESLFPAPRPSAPVSAVREAILPRSAPARIPPSDPAAAMDQAIAIVGLGLRFPGARTAEEFWANLAAGKSSITEVPPGRWDQGEVNGPGAGNPRQWGGFLTEIDRFDPAFFGISPREAGQMDPQERLFLEVAWETLEDAGYTRQRLARATGGEGGASEVGVFVGVMYGAYQMYAAMDPVEENSPGPISPYWSVANRISYFCNFHGPSLAVDTACSASLTAIHLACESLRRGECRAALAGGVTLMVHPRQFQTLAAMKMLSRDEHCRAFGEGADGFVPGEGVGSVLLRPLAEALRDGDRIYGVIRGSAVNAGGKTSGYTVPDPVAQSKVIAAAWKRAGVEPGSVSCIEAHGTGTALGDPIEIRGLARAFGSGEERTAFCALGSVKSNLGHLQAAAGIASLAKVLLQLKHRQFVPTLNAGRANPLIDLEHSPFYLVKDLRPWERATRKVDGEEEAIPRRAGLSSFGVGGANAHVLVEEWDAPGQAAAVEENELHLFPLSARTEEALREYAAKFRAWLDSPACAATGLGDLAFSWQTGKESMERRLALVVRDRGELAGKLETYLANRPDPGVLVSQGLDTNHPVVAALGGLVAGTRLAGDLLAQGDLPRLAALWAAGFDLDWVELHRGQDRRRVSLPSYPFARKSFWVSRPASVPPVRSGTPAAGIAGEGSRAQVAPAAPASGPDSARAGTTRGLDVPGLVALVIEEVADALKMERGEVDPDKPFNEFGVDSLVGTALAKSLGDRLDLAVSATLLWDYPTIRAIADYLATQKPMVAAAKLGETAPAAGAATPLPSPLQDSPGSTALPVEPAEAKDRDQGAGEATGEDWLARLRGLTPEATPGFFRDFLDGPGQAGPVVTTPPLSQGKKRLDFSLLFFSSNGESAGPGKYDLLLQASQVADQLGFHALWMPERHFHPVGGLFPNPSVVAAAVAVLTRQIRLRAGSVVAPLHHPLRVAEEWAVVDNLSDGRVDLSFARGWNPNDFVLSPGTYRTDNQLMRSQMDTIRELWRGGTIRLPNALGEQAEVRVFPRPRQPELTCWMTCMGGADRFREAAEAGANVLTMLYNQTVDDLREKIQVYRAARAGRNDAGDRGTVTLMLHCFVHPDLDFVRQTVKEPFMAFLRSTLNLHQHGAKIRGIEPSAEEQERIVEFAYERYFRTGALFGTPESCQPMIEKLIEAGVDEVACQVDFGVEAPVALAAIPHLAGLMQRNRLPVAHES